MLGDSVRRRRTGGPKKRRAEAARRVPWAWLLGGLGALLLPFGIGYLIAVRVIYPPDEVEGEGIAVPRLIGMQVAEASQSLSELGLGPLQTTELPTPSAARGRITAQDPLPGQQLRAGATVRVAVSAGAPRGRVPDVAGFPTERARRLLERLGFEVQETIVESDAVSGRVLSVEPEPGTERELPSLVTVTVSAGPPRDTMAVDTSAAFPADTGTSILRSMHDFNDSTR